MAQSVEGGRSVHEQRVVGPARCSLTPTVWRSHPVACLSPPGSKPLWGSDGKTDFCSLGQFLSVAATSLLVETGFVPVSLAFVCRLCLHGPPVPSSTAAWSLMVIVSVSGGKGDKDLCPVCPLGRKV